MADYYALKAQDGGFLMMNRNKIKLVAIFRDEKDAKECLNRMYIDDDWQWQWIGETPMPVYHVEKVSVNTLEESQDE